MLFDTIKKVLVLAPHTDDAEFGCGGTMGKLIDHGIEVHVAAFSSCEHSVRPEFSKDVLVHELRAACAVLGVKKDHIHLYNYDVRTFNFHRQEILEDLIVLKKEIQPDLVFMPSINDIHQDHATICDEGIRAFKFSSILCYEMPWNNFNFTTTCFVRLSEKQLDAKVRALAEYKSQSHRLYASSEFIHSLAFTRGVQSGGRYAEVFEIVRWII